MLLQSTINMFAYFEQRAMSGEKLSHRDINAAASNVSDDDVVDAVNYASSKVNAPKDIPNRELVVFYWFLLMVAMLPRTPNTNNVVPDMLTSTK